MQNTCFQSKRKRIIPNFTRIFMLIVLHLAAFWTAFSTKIDCVLPQNALHLAANCIAFWCKLHCVLHHIAGYFAANCRLSAQFVRQLYIYMQFHLLSASTILCQNKPSRESIICSWVSGRWIKTALITLNFLPKNGQCLIKELRS